jgi:ABC-type Fe3+ transport system substrate-binding protein
MIHKRALPHPRVFALPLVLALAGCGAAATPSPLATTAPATTAPASPAPATAAPTTAPTVAPTAVPVTPAPATASPQTGVVAGDLAAVCEAGTQEGSLVYWNNLSEPDPIFAAFNAAYPGITIESTQLRPDESAQRVLTEASVGKVSADLIYGGLDVFQPVLAAELINQQIGWESLGAAPDTINSGMVRIYRVAGGLGYNTDKFTADQIPSTWEELIDAKWEGQVVVDPRGRPFDQLSLSTKWGKDATIDYVNRLKSTVKPVVIEGGTAGMVAVASGEYAITTGGRSAETLEQQAEGAPIDIKYLDIIPTLDAYHAVLNDATHPNAAACWVAWIATAGKTVHDESEFKSNETVPSSAPAGAEILAIDDPDKADAVGEMSDLIGPIWTGQ